MRAIILILGLMFLMTACHNDNSIKSIAVSFIKNMSEYQRNNGSNILFIRSNPLPGGAVNVVYQYDVHTKNLPDFIKKQEVHLLIENNTVRKYMIAEVSDKVVKR